MSFGEKFPQVATLLQAKEETEHLRGMHKLWKDTSGETLKGEEEEETLQGNI